MPTYLGLEAGELGADHNFQVQGRTLAINKQLTMCHIVLGDTLDDTEDTILGTAGIPLLGDFLRGATCRRRRPKEIATVVHPETGQQCGLWKVEVDYDSSVDSQAAQNAGSSQGNPTTQRPKRRWRTNKVAEILEADAFTGLPITTTAGEPIVIEDDIPHPVLEITRIENYPFEPVILYEYCNHTNDDIFYGAPPGCALMDDIYAEEIIIENEDFVQVTYVIEFRVMMFRPFNLVNIFLPDGWDIQVPNAGYLYRPRLHPADLEPGGTLLGEPVTNIINGQPQVTNLDSDGSKLSVDDEPIFIDVARKIRTPFAPLGLEF